MTMTIIMLMLVLLVSTTIISGCHASRLMSVRPISVSSMGNNKGIVGASSSNVGESGAGVEMGTTTSTCTVTMPTRMLTGLTPSPGEASGVTPPPGDPGSH